MISGTSWFQRMNSLYPETCSYVALKWCFSITFNDYLIEYSRKTILKWATVSEWWQAICSGNRFKSLAIGMSGTKQLPEYWIMMMSSNGNIFHVTGPLWGVTGGFPSQMPMKWAFDIFFDLCLIKWLSKQWRRQWFEMPSLIMMST